MAGMPEMQEQFPAMAMDGWYAANAEATSGYGHGWPVCRKCRSNFRLRPRIAGMPAMQKQFPPHGMAGVPKMQEHFPAGSRPVQRATPRRPSRAKFMQMVYAAAQVNRA